MLGDAAPLLRIAGRLEEARKTASAAIALAELLEDPRAVFSSQVALAQVMQREGRFEISTLLFDRLIVQARSSPQFTDSLHNVLFHAGTNLFDQERYTGGALLPRGASAAAHARARRSAGDVRRGDPPHQGALRQGCAPR